MSYLTAAEAAERLGVHPVTIRKEIASGRLPALRLGRVYRIREDDLDRLRYEPPAPPTLAHADLQPSPRERFDSFKARARAA